ncbi:MAG: M28 family peptidase [Candidatus Latescibacteria bacterium]|nr:M28 family peptidase [Candidatus Latescibacterota bacterium]
MRHTIRILALTVLLPLVACRTDEQHPYSQAGITGQELLYHIRYLASDELGGRLSGTPGADQAAQYIAREFQRYGLRPAGDDGEWRQSFDFVAGLKVGAHNHLTVTAGTQTTYTAGTDYLPLAFSSTDTADGSVVFAGYGIVAPEMGYDDYQDIDVKGKIVLVLRYGPDGTSQRGEFGRYITLRNKAVTARMRGAAGLLIVTGPESTEADALVPLRQDPLFTRAGLPAASISPNVAAEILSAAGMTLQDIQRHINQERRGAPFAIPSMRVTLWTDIVKEWQQTANVVGLLQGTEKAQQGQVIVIGAHYDHLGLGGPSSLAPRDGAIHHGADDNASGTAGLLELAQVFAAHRKGLKRSLLFIAFSGEEEGLLGSAHYVKHPSIPLAKTVAMINLDMIGRQRGRTLIVHGTGTATQWQDLLNRLNQSAFELQFKADGYGPSDHTSFYNQDVPVLFFYTGTHEDYHKPSDTPEKINVQGEQGIVEYVYRVVSEIDRLPDPPAFVRVRTGESPAGTGSGSRSP